MLRLPSLYGYCAHEFISDQPTRPSEKAPLIFRDDSAGAKGGPLAGPPFSLDLAFGIKNVPKPYGCTIIYGAQAGVISSRKHALPS
jgi:hypothetical protein